MKKLRTLLLAGSSSLALWGAAPLETQAQEALDLPAARLEETAARSDEDLLAERFEVMGTDEEKAQLNSLLKETLKTPTGREVLLGMPPSSSQKLKLELEPMPQMRGGSYYHDTHEIKMNQLTIDDMPRSVSIFTHETHHARQNLDKMFRPEATQSLKDSFIVEQLSELSSALKEAQTAVEYEQASGKPLKSSDMPLLYKGLLEKGEEIYDAHPEKERKDLANKFARTEFATILWNDSSQLPLTPGMKAGSGLWRDYYTIQATAGMTTERGGDPAEADRMMSYYIDAMGLDAQKITPDYLRETLPTPMLHGHPVSLSADKMAIQTTGKEVPIRQLGEPKAGTLKYFDYTTEPFKDKDGNETYSIYHREGSEQVTRGPHAETVCAFDISGNLMKRTNKELIPLGDDGSAQILSTHSEIYENGAKTQEYMEKEGVSIGCKQTEIGVLTTYHGGRHGSYEFYAPETAEEKALEREELQKWMSSLPDHEQNTFSMLPERLSLLPDLRDPPAGGHLKETLKKSMLPVAPQAPEKTTAREAPPAPAVQQAAEKKTLTKAPEIPAAQQAPTIPAAQQAPAKDSPSLPLLKHLGNQGK